MEFKVGDKVYVTLSITYSYTTIVWSCPSEHTFNVDYKMETKELDNYEGLRKITKLEKALK